MEIVFLFGFIILVVLVLFGLDRFGLWLEDQGYIYYRKSRVSPSVGVGNALIEFNSVFDSNVKNMYEIQQEQEQDGAESGDPPFDLTGVTIPGLDISNKQENHPTSSKTQWVTCREGHRREVELDLDGQRFRLLDEPETWYSIPQIVEQGKIVPTDTIPWCCARQTYMEYMKEVKRNQS